MNCPSCGHANPAAAHFCNECAGPLSTVCSSCGGVNPPRARFCNRCAAPFESRPPEREPRAYTPKHLADKILRSKSALEGERKQVTVLFADVKSSLELAERLDAEEWHRILERFFGILTEGVHRFEGTVNQYTGDGIMALFGAPIAHEDHAQRACYAALWLRDELRRYADELQRSRGLDFSVRMGLNSGEVVVGKIGDDLRMDYTAQGHTVGLAARLEGLAEPGEVYVTEGTARLVEGFFELRDLGPKGVAGMHSPVQVYGLLGVGRLHTRLELAQTRGLTAFVGRDRELGVLEGGLEQALAGQGQIIGVVGDPGVGKSRLCLEFVRSCRERGVEVVEAHCPSHGKTEPFGAILQLLRAVFGLRESDRDAAARDHVAAQLAELDAAFAEQLPLVFDFLGLPDPERPAPRMDPQVREQRLQRFVRQLLQAMSRRVPVVVFLDDTHWIDEASNRFLATVSASVGGTRTLLLVNFRPEYAADWMQGSGYYQLPLRALGPGDAETLLRALAGADAANAPLLERIRDATGGNPFFLEEVVQSLVESNALQGERGAYRLAHAVDSISIPATVQAVLAARIDRLSEREKQVLQTASVIGRVVPEALLARVATLPPSELDLALAHLRRAEFLYEAALLPDVVHEFKHPLTREVAYESQLGERRAATHAAVADALEELHAERLDSQASLLAYHRTRARQPLDAVRWYNRAWVYFWQTNHREAQRCCHEMLGLLADAKGDWGEEGARLLVEACGAALFAGWSLGISRLEAESLLEKAREAASLLPEADGDRGMAPLLLGYANVATRWDPETAIRHAREAFFRAERSLGEAERIEVRRMLVFDLWAVARYREAWELTEPVIASPPADPLARAPWSTITPFPGLLRQGSIALAMLGRPRDALEHLEHAFALVRAAGKSVPLDEVTLTGDEFTDENYMQALAWAAVCYALLGDGERALRCARGSSMGKILQSPIFTYAAYHVRAMALRGVGEWAELAEAATKVRDLAPELGMPQGTGLALLALAQSHLGQRRDALETASQALRSGPDLAVVEGAARALLHTGRAERSDEVATALDTLEKMIEWTEARAFSPLLHELRAQLARVTGDETGCERERARAERLWTEMGAHGHIERMARDLEELSRAP